MVPSAVTLSPRFYATVRCRLRHYTKADVEGDQNQKHAGTKNGLQALITANQRKEASGKSVRPARALQLFSQQGLYNARPPRPQPKLGCNIFTTAFQLWHKQDNYTVVAFADQL